jgi:hypothetical protein
VGREKPEREEKEEEERSGKKVGSGLNAGSSAPVTTAPSHPGARRQRRWRLARRQHQWRPKGPFSEFFPPGVYL